MLVAGGLGAPRAGLAGPRLQRGRHVDVRSPLTARPCAASHASLGACGTRTAVGRLAACLKRSAQRRLGGRPPVLLAERRADAYAIATAVKACEADDHQVVTVAACSATRPTWRSWRSAPTCGGCAAADRPAGGRPRRRRFVRVDDRGLRVRPGPARGDEAGSALPAAAARRQAGVVLLPDVEAAQRRPELVHAALRRAQGAHVRARRDRAQVRRAGAAGHHRLHRRRRLRVGRHAVRACTPTT